MDKIVLVRHPSYVARLKKYPVIIMIKNFWDVYKLLLELQVEDERICYGCSRFANKECKKLVYSEGARLENQGG